MRVPVMLRPPRKWFPATALALVGLGIAGLFVASAPAKADTIVWANDGGAINGRPGPNLEEWDVNVGAATATLLNSFAAPLVQGLGGEGIAVIGSNVYYSVFTSGNVFVTNTSGSSSGVAFSTGLSGISSIATDGRFLYLAPAATTNDIYQYTVGGSLVSTIPLIPSQVATAIARVGLEVVGTDFVANQQQDIGPYDKFSAAGGAPTVPQFIGSLSDFGKAGIAFDGTDYFVFDDEAQPSQFVIYDASGVFIERVNLNACPGPNVICDIRDLSVVTAAVAEPPTLSLVAAGLIGLAMLFRRRSRSGSQNRLS